jgi:Ca2+/Na+ antiporter
VRGKSSPDICRWLDSCVLYYTFRMGRGSIIAIIWLVIGVAWAVRSIRRDDTAGFLISVVFLGAGVFTCMPRLDP